MIHLEEINADNWRLGLKVSEEQSKYVSNDMKLLARAYAYREHRSKAVIIYSDNTPIGMALYYDCEELKAYDFSQFFIDERYQGRGYGYTVTQMILEEMKKDSTYHKVILCYIEGNKEALSLYKKCGFVHTGETDGNEIVMELKI